jgi:hypothetical protein
MRGHDRQRPIRSDTEERCDGENPKAKYDPKAACAGGYGLPKLGWIIEMVAYDVSVNVVFLGGADFDPPPPLGDTDRRRYIKLTTLEEAQGPEIRKWIKQAGRVPGWN